ncbi:MAG TPA: hypothetical protein VK917_01525 [Ilumatobacter sp.]|nr:hypothetical protein [Ilumatobacter sp.]
MDSTIFDRSVPTDLLYVQHTATERRRRLTSAAEQRRLRRWFRE